MSHPIPKVSVITVCLNSASTIERTIRSVVGQSYTNIEYIIIDGGSTDGTLDVVRKFHARISRLVSEKDSGIYDAMNKGIAVATGDWICFLNSDDCFHDDRVVEDMLQAVAKGGGTPYMAYGKVNVINQYTGQKRPFGGPVASVRDFYYNQAIAHPATFFRRDVFELVGVYDARIAGAADYDWYVRFMMHPARPQHAFIDRVIADFTDGGRTIGFLHRNFVQRRRAAFRYFPWHVRMRYAVFTPLSCLRQVILRTQAGWCYRRLKSRLLLILGSVYLDGSAY